MPSFALDLWTGLSLLGKFGIYLGFSGTLGGLFCLRLARSSIPPGLELLISRYLLIVACAGLGGTVLHFLAQVGAVAGQGLVGMFDRNLIGIFASGNTGAALYTRMSGFLLIGLIATCDMLWQPNPLLRLLKWVGILLTGSSFLVVGHSIDLGLWGSAALALHLVAVALWTGSLFPLWYLARHFDGQQIAPVMRDFGRMALGFVAVLVLAGGYLAVQLLSSWSQLLNSAWGVTLLLKLTLVVALLGLAAMNKLLLTPALQRGESGDRLRRSIGLEIWLAAPILLVTAFLSSAVGPN